MSKRYLVYYGKIPQYGINSYDSKSALEEARLKTPRGMKSKVRVRLAKKGTLLWSLAS